MDVLEVGLEESADEADLADLNPEFDAVYDVATEFPGSTTKGRPQSSRRTSEILWRVIWRPSLPLI